VERPAAVAPDPDPVAAGGRFAPDPAPVARAVDEGEPAAGVATDAQPGLDVVELQEGRQEAVHEPGPARPDRPRTVQAEPERDPVDGRGDLGVGRAGRLLRARRTIRRLATDEIAQDRHPVDRGGRRDSRRHGDPVVDEVRPRVGRVAEMIVIRSVGERPGAMVTARPVARVRHDDQGVGPAGLGCRNMRHCR